MRSLFGIICIAAVIVVWFLGDQAAHGGGGPLATLDHSLRMVPLVGAGVLGLLLGLVMDPAKASRAFGAVPEGFGIRGLPRWLVLTAMLLPVAAATGWVVEVYFRHLNPQSDVTMMSAAWDAVAIGAVMLTLLRPARRRQTVA